MPILRRKRAKCVFISHAAKDRRFLLKLTNVLNNHGIAYWYSPSALVGADQWHDEIGKALDRCDWFLVVLTPHSIKSLWVKRELLFALKQPRYRNRIIPVYVANCNPVKLSWALDDSQRVDFRKDFDVGCTDLLRIWNIQYRP